MRPEYLGDCLDFYKRWFLAEFFPKERLVALPMLTDAWTPADRATYSALLGVDVIQEDIVPNRRERAPYFRLLEEHHGRDIFIDPDTGLRVGQRPARRRFDEYLFDGELRDHVVPMGSSQVAVVYDQSIARGLQVESAESKLRALAKMECWAFAYCAQVAMVVVSRNRARIEDLYGKARGMSHVPGDRLLNNLSDTAGVVLA